MRRPIHSYRLASQVRDLRIEEVPVVRNGLCGVLLFGALAACSGGAGEAPGEVAVFDGIADDEVINALGTEPFWSAEIIGNAMVYSTPENIEGRRIELTRFAGNGGLGFTGNFDGSALQLAVTPGECSDGMSDRTYPFTVTLKIDEALLAGCAYTDTQSFSGEELP